jgi:hypothetical protein
MTNATPLPLSEMLLYTAVKIVRIKNGAEDGSGTGFYYSIDVGNDRHIPLLVTNKHVIEGCDTIEIACHLSDTGTPARPSGKFALFRLATSSAFLHPNSDIDLCVLPIIAACADAVSRFGADIFRATLSRETIPDAATWAEFAAIEEVTMVGCPRGIFDQANNLPIFRKGITASAPSKLYNGKPEFMVDMACYPGSSGSPVVILNQGAYFANGGVNMGSRFHFMGILYAGPLVTNQGIVLGTPPKVAVQAMMHLGQVIRSTELLALEQVVLAAHSISKS